MTGTVTTPLPADPWCPDLSEYQDDQQRTLQQQHLKILDRDD